MPPPGIYVNGVLMTVDQMRQMGEDALRSASIKMHTHATNQNFYANLAAAAKKRRDGIFELKEFCLRPRNARVILPPNHEGGISCTAVDYDIKIAGVVRRVKKESW
ncbi:MAG TPA: hypothetical protein VJB96_02530 [Patescibacteria group bacterium]|nr:hypothetical protein [Patescibacteria group bacterium]